MKRNLHATRKREVHKLFGGACYYCGKSITLAQSSLDHVYPLTLGTYTDDPQNIVLACRHCNGDKSDTLPCEWAMQRRGGGFPGEAVMPWQEILDWHTRVRQIAPVSVSWTIAGALKGVRL